MELSDEQLLIQKSAREFAQKKLAPYSAQWAQNAHYPIDALRELGALGFLGMLVPEQWGGTDIGYVAYVLAIEAIAMGDPSTSTLVSVQNSVASCPILNFGTSEQKEKFLMPLAKGEVMGAFALSEPQAGSEAFNLRTTATKTQSGYCLNGVKQFVTSGQHAQSTIVIAITDKGAAKKGLSAFIVPTHTPGYEVSRVEKKMGQEAAETAQIQLNECVVPDSHRLGEEGMGYKIALSELESGRLGISAQAIGMAQTALDACVQYTQERTSFGQPLNAHQNIRFQLAHMATQLQAARSLLLSTAQRKQSGHSCLKEAAMCKLFATEMAEEVCRMAIQIHGGYGYLQDFPLERLYRDVRVTTIYEGTSEVQKMIIAKALTGS